MPDSNSRIAYACSRILFWLGAGLLIAAAARAGQPPRTPLLRIEVGTHVDVIRALAVNASASHAVTASDDKTARVWDVATGLPGPVLRIPIGAEREGHLQAAVMSADGRVVAVAGNSGQAWTGQNSVYVFDRTSGRLLRRLDTGSARPVVSLALSADARWLAVGLADPEGLRVLDFNSGAQVFAARDFAGSLYALDFAPDGRRLAVGATDGHVRLFVVQQGQLKAPLEVADANAKLVSQVRFSPDGRLLAVGFDDTARVLLLDGESLDAVADLPAPSSARAGAFSNLSWTGDGRYLWGGGTFRVGNQWGLRRWARDNWDQVDDLPIAGASLLALAPTPTGVLYASSEASWGLVDGAGRATQKSRTPLVSHAGLGRQFTVSADASRVGFRMASGAMHVMDIGQRQISPLSAASASGLATARTDAPGLNLEHWQNERRPTLNGRLLALPEREVSRALAISPNAQQLVLGTDGGLWLFDAQGRTIWQRALPSVVWSVNISGDGRWVVSAGNDGIVRWHRTADGQEMLALLPHADQRRWVLWTPSGFFDAAAGAEDLLGWHVNRSAAEAADFFPLWTLRNRLRRPDVVDRLLSAGDEREAERQANAAAGRTDEAPIALADVLPPVLEASGEAPQWLAAQRQLRLQVNIRTLPSALMTGLRARADGRPAAIQVVTSTSGTRDVSVARELRVTLAGRPSMVQVLAENRFGVSAPLTVRMSWTNTAADADSAAAKAVATATAQLVFNLAQVATAPVVSGTAAATAGTASVSAVLPPPVAAIPPAAKPPPPATKLPPGTPLPPTPPTAPAQTPIVGEGFEIAPKLYVLAIGVGAFADPSMPALAYASKDARDFAQTMRGQGGGLYRAVEVRVLTDAQATRDSIVDGLDWLQRQVTQHDVGMLFVAGHGTNDPTLGYLFIPFTYDGKSVRRTAVNMEDFNRTLKNLTGKALFFIDTCHSGNVLGGARARAIGQPNDLTGMINELASAENGVVVFSAATGRQYSLESPDWGNGAFTKALIEGIGGKADYKHQGRLTYKMLDLYLTERVKELTQGKQTPVTQAPGGVPDFPIAAVR